MKPCFLLLNFGPIKILSIVGAQIETKMIFSLRKCHIYKPKDMLFTIR
jgi:hypothetical protein